jgi:hypothetical protein
MVFWTVLLPSAMALCFRDPMGSNASNGHGFDWAGNGERREMRKRWGSGLAFDIERLRFNIPLHFREEPGL